MPRSFSASDRSVLVRFASSLPKGSPERRTILLDLTRSASGASVSKKSSYTIVDSDGDDFSPEAAKKRAKRTINGAKKLLKSAESYLKAMKAGKLPGSDMYFTDFTVPVEEGYNRAGARDLGYDNDEDTHADSDGYNYSDEEVEKRVATTVRELNRIKNLAESFLKGLESGDLKKGDKFIDLTPPLQDGFDSAAPREVSVVG